MNKKAISKSIILKYGALLGMIAIVISIYLYLFDKHLEQNQTVGILNILLILAAIILGIRTYTKIAPLNFGDGIKIGKASALLAASVFHFNELSINEVKNYLKSNGINVRM